MSTCPRCKVVDLTLNDHEPECLIGQIEDQLAQLCHVNNVVDVASWVIRQMEWARTSCADLIAPEGTMDVDAMVPLTLAPADWKPSDG